MSKILFTVDDECILVPLDDDGAAGGGGGGWFWLECEVDSGTNGSAKSRSRSCMYALIKTSNFSSMSATWKCFFDSKFDEQKLQLRIQFLSKWTYYVDCNFVLNLPFAQLWQHAMLNLFSMHTHLLLLILVCQEFGLTCNVIWNLNFLFIFFHLSKLASNNATHEDIICHYQTSNTINWNEKSRSFWSFLFTKNAERKRDRAMRTSEFACMKNMKNMTLSSETEKKTNNETKIQPTHVSTVSFFV